MKLKNGATLLDRHPLPDRPGQMKAEIVLAKIDDHETHTPFVTWQRNVDENSTYWGHYFKTEHEARQDFNRRAAHAQ